MDPLIPLSIVLPRPGSRARLVSLHQQLRSAILDGRLRPGVRLPSTRALAAAHGVSRNTAVAAYDLLLSEGYISARRGSGTVVAATLPASPARPRAATRSAFASRLARGGRARLPPSRAEPATVPRCDFRIGVPDAQGFPHVIWHRLLRRVARELRGAAATDRDPQGQHVLREAIARHVSFTRAVACAPAEIVVTAGAQQAFDLLARVLGGRGRATVALEDPGYPPLRAVFAAHGARITPVPVDAEGLVVERIPRDCQVVCVTPSHQFPLGAVMSAPRRAALLELARRRGVVIVEDDYDSEFRFAERPLDALQTLDRAQSVFYVGTFSKSLTPDIRLGYLVAPPWAVPALVAAKQLADGHCNPVTQGAVALMIRGGHLARHVRRMQRIYGARRARILAALGSDLAPWLESQPSVAGLHVTALAHGARDERALAALAREADVGVATLARFFARTPTAGGLVFGFGNTPEEVIAPGLDRLCGTLQARLRR